MPRLGLIAPRQSAIGLLEGIKFARDEQERSLDLLRKEQQIVNNSLINDQLQQKIDFTSKANPLAIADAEQKIELNNQKIHAGVLDLRYKPIVIEQGILASQQKLRAGEVSIDKGRTEIKATEARIKSTDANTAKTEIDTLIAQGYGAEQAQAIIDERNARVEESLARSRRNSVSDPIDQLIQQYNEEPDPDKKQAILEQIRKIKNALNPQRVSTQQKPSIIGRSRASSFGF